MFKKLLKCIQARRLEDILGGFTRVQRELEQFIADQQEIVAFQKGEHERLSQAIKANEAETQRAGHVLNKLTALTSG